MYINPFFQSDGQIFRPQNSLILHEIVLNFCRLCPYDTKMCILFGLFIKAILYGNMADPQLLKYFNWIDVKLSRMFHPGLKIYLPFHIFIHHNFTRVTAFMAFCQLLNR